MTASIVTSRWAVATGRSSTLLIAVALLKVVCVGCASESPVDPSSCVAASETDLAAFAVRQDVDCVIEVIGTDLESLDALSGLRRVEGLILANNAELRDVSVIAELEGFRIFSAQGTPLSAALDVTPANGDIYVTGSEVTALEGRQSAAAIIAISENSTLERLSFPALVDVNSLVLDDNESLSGLLNAFPVLTNARQLSIRNARDISRAEIEALAAQANTPAESLSHCGNADDEPCEELEGLD